MLIECASCTMRARRHGGPKSHGRPDGQREVSECDDCVVTVLLSMPPVESGRQRPVELSVEVHDVGDVPLAAFDAAERSAIAVLADEGLIAPLQPEPRYVPVGLVTESDGRRAG